MSDTLMTVIAIFIAAILMFVFPLMWTANSQEEISQTTVETLVANFVNNVATKGKLTKTDYEDFLYRLNSTGNSFDVEIEIQKLDDNPGRKTILTHEDKIGENIYYSVFTSTILNDDTLGIYKNTKGEFILNKGDYIIVNVKNTNTTLATQIKNFLFKIVGKDVHTIAASSTALIINNGRSN